MTQSTLRLDSVRVVWEADLESEWLEAERCYAKAEVSYPINENGDRRLETVTSAGLNGIQLAGPDDPYRTEVELEQLTELRDHLRAFNVPTRDFARRFAPALQE
jgi:hypothetical protein